MLNDCTNIYHIILLTLQHPLFANDVSTVLWEMELNAFNLALDAQEASARQEDARRFLLGAATGPVARRPQGVGGLSIQDIIQNAMANQMAAIEAMEAQRRSNPEWAKYYEFQSWLEKEKSGDGDRDEGEELEDVKMPANNGGRKIDEGGEEGVDLEDVKMPAGDANIEPLNKKAKNGTMGEENFGGEGDDDEIEWEDNNLNLDNLHKDDNMQRQLDALGPYLFRKKEMIRLGYPPSFFWRALWSTETQHDNWFGAYRLRHFGRWDREDVPDDDPWRWKTPHSYDGCDGLTMALYFPGKAALHDAKVRYISSR